MFIRLVSHSLYVVFVEWTGLSSDLMGDSGRGQVSEDMINTLIKTYSRAMSEHGLDLTLNLIEYF